MKSCFGYIRVSTAKHGEGASLQGQKDAITNFASQNGIKIIKWLEELETASKMGRPVFGQMLKNLRNGKADGVVIHRIDRSARNFSDWARLDEVARNGTKVYFAADSLDFDTRGGRLPSAEAERVAGRPRHGSIGFAQFHADPGAQVLAKLLVAIKGQDFHHELFALFVHACGVVFAQQQRQLQARHVDLARDRGYAQETI